MGIFLSRLVLSGCAAAALSGCGIATDTLGAASSAALAPAAGIVQSANIGLQALDHTATTLTPAIKSATTQVAQSTRTVQSYQTAAATPTSYTPPTVQQLPKSTTDAMAKGKKAPQPDLQFLPDETFKKLSKDQRGLQNAAQKAALTAAVGETIFWDNEDRHGTVMVKDEHKYGELQCRTFAHTVKIDGTDYDADGNACLDADSGKWQKAF